MGDHDEAPESTLPYPPLYEDAEIVVLSDWDGTITTYDSNDYLTDNLGFGKDKRRQGNLDILSGKATFRDAFREMLQSVVDNGHGYEECKDVLRKNIHLDPGFKTFHSFCKSHSIPVIIVSSGMEPTIRAVLTTLLDADDAKTIPIVSNDVNLTGEDDKQWMIQFRHPTSGFGHDKSQAILPYRRLAESNAAKGLGHRPRVIFFGDGVSDMSAAKHADWLFVKEKDHQDNDLAAYCRREQIPHRIFGDFAEVVPIVEGFLKNPDTKFGVNDEHR